MVRNKKRTIVHFFSVTTKVPNKLIGFIINTKKINFKLLDCL